MKNFGRVLRLALGYPWTIVGIVLSSLSVAVLWGGNIGVVYPFVEVIVSGQSLQQWVDKKIESSETVCRELNDQLAGRLPTTPAAPSAADSGSIGAAAKPSATASSAAPASQATTLVLAAVARDPSLVRDRLAAEERALQLYRTIQPWIHSHLPSDPYQTLLLIIGALMVATIIKDSMLVLNLLLVERLGQLVLLDLRKMCYRSSLDMDMAAFHDQSAGKYLSHFTSDSAVASAGLVHLFGTSLREPLKMLACLAGAAWICWQLLLLSLLCAPIAGYLIRRLSQSMKRANRRALEQNTQYFQTLTETFGGILTIKAYTMERFERTRFQRLAHEMFRKSMRATLYASLTKPIIEVLGIGIIALAIVSGAYLVLHQETHLLGVRMCSRPLTFSSLLVFYGLLAGASDPARKLSEIYSALQGAVVASDRLFGFLDQKPKIVDPDSPKELKSAFSKIVVDKVSFGYRSDHQVLRELSVTIQAGETLAIVGPNGCGKSTFINLLPRFYDPQSGVIRLDDTDIRDCRLRDLRSQLGIGCPEATDEQVIEAAKQAHAHQFIVDRLEAGYETIVGQGGAKLSGGQRQRIALARAILRDPALLILDEATSQVDLESERLIHKALERFIVGRTAIMITHRLSTLDLADRILVMDEGRVVDLGSHDELIARCEVYRRLHEIQFRQSA
jgi:subfamily B ATP-binding cassette protein MsbA